MQGEWNGTATSAGTIHPKDSKTSDAGKVRLGGQSPSLPIRGGSAAVADGGKVRLGGQTPSL